MREAAYSGASLTIFFVLLQLRTHGRFKSYYNCIYTIVGGIDGSAAIAVMPSDNEDLLHYDEQLNLQKLVCMYIKIIGNILKYFASAWRLHVRDP